MTSALSNNLNELDVLLQVSLEVFFYTPHPAQQCQQSNQRSFKIESFCATFVQKNIEYIRF
jgi:hypothetical protein